MSMADKKKFLETIDVALETLQEYKKQGEESILYQILGHMFDALMEEGQEQGTNAKERAQELGLSVIQGGQDGNTVH